MDLEVRCTLDMLPPDQAIQLKEAGLTAYNHKVGSSRSGVLATPASAYKLSKVYIEN